MSESGEGGRAVELLGEECRRRKSQGCPDSVMDWRQQGSGSGHSREEDAMV